MSNYFNTLPLRVQLEELGKCRFMEPEEFANGVDAIKDKNDPSIVLHRMMLLGHYMKAAIALVKRIDSNLITAALQHFLQAGGSDPNGDCNGAGGVTCPSW